MPSIPDSNLPVWDRAGALARIQDDALLRRVTRIFLDDLPGLLGRIREAAASGQCQDAELAAHALKAAASNVGAEQCRAAAAALERLARAGEGRALAPGLAGFEAAARRFRAAADSLGEPPPGGPARGAAG